MMPIRKSINAWLARKGWPGSLSMVALIVAVSGSVLAGIWSLPASGSSRALVVGLLSLSFASALVAYWAHRRCAAAVADRAHQAGRAAQLRLTTIEALALAIDARDRTTQSIRREQAYAAALAGSLGMSDSEIEAIRTAALLHDVGKLAVPDHILTKPGPLTPDELQKVRIHSQVGADIVAGIPFPYAVAPLVLCHHERWDGSGYPNGLRGDSIPLGARILAVVDHFEALTSQRPFHPPMPHEDAVTVLWSEAGKALDPAVVARFVELLPRLARTEVGSTGRPVAVGPFGRDALHDIGQAHREIHGLYEVARSMGTTLGVAETMEVIAAGLQTLVPFSDCALFLWDLGTGLAHCRWSRGPNAARLAAVSVETGQGAAGLAIARGESVVTDDVSSEFPVSARDEATPRHALACPLVAQDSMVGAIVLYRSQSDAFRSDHVRVTKAVASQAAAVLANALVFEQTREDSVTDSLTGLPNTRFMDVHMKRELARAARQDTPVALLLLDCDNLKTVNDTYGHQTGDQVLRDIAGVLRNAIRPYDVCARYGGDEFIVALADCGLKEAEAKGRELQQAIEYHPLTTTRGTRLRCSISFGAAAFPADGSEYQALLAAADSRMYADKEARRQPGGRGRDHGGGAVTEVDIQRAAAGIL
ncbi:MAG: diguanylate cyclase [Acidobacteriota bacterium]